MQLLYSVKLETGTKIRLTNQDILLIWLGALIGAIASKLLSKIGVFELPS